jgi:uncharacterized membrane protein
MGFRLWGVEGGSTLVPFEGSGVGLVVLVVLLAAFVYALAATVLAIFGRAVHEGPAWSNFLIPVLCVVGLGVAGYLTFVETRQVAAICGPVGDCNTVQSSPYAKLFGFLPVGLLGFLGYLAILLAWVIGQFSKSSLSGLAKVAVLFSIYLTYLELAVILAICMWCLTSAVIMAVLLFLATRSALAHLVYQEMGDQ